jgi:hypothetical protein
VERDIAALRMGFGYAGNILSCAKNCFEVDRAMIKINSNPAWWWASEKGG